MKNVFTCWCFTRFKCYNNQLKSTHFCCIFKLYIIIIEGKHYHIFQNKKNAKKGKSLHLRRNISFWMQCWSIQHSLFCLINDPLKMHSVSVNILNVILNRGQQISFIPPQWINKGVKRKNNQWLLDCESKFEVICN